MKSIDYSFLLLDSFHASSWPVFDAHASGFRECIDEISRYLISVEGFDAQHPLRLRLLSHLECFTERSLSPSSSSSATATTTTNTINDIDHSWPLVHQQSPSAFAPPPLSSYPSTPTMISYHPHPPASVHHQVTNSSFPMHHYPPPPLLHHYHQQRPPVDASTSSSTAAAAAACF